MVAPSFQALAKKLLVVGGTGGVGNDQPDFASFLMDSIFSVAPETPSTLYELRSWINLMLMLGYLAPLHL